MAKRRVIFHRSFNIHNGGNSGGQIKVRDTFEHFRHSDIFEPKVYFGPYTVWYEGNGNVWLPYLNSEDEIKEWTYQEGDVMLFAGVDWRVLSEAERANPPRPILNIAHPRHCMPTDKRNGFLQHRAIRITKSSISKKILDDYGVNGPVYLIPDAIDLSDLPEPNRKPDIDVLIIGLKNPGLAVRLKERMDARNKWKFRKVRTEIQIPPKLPTRQHFLELLNRCRIACFLPLTEDRGSEGFYLPALEGMALEKTVVCPYAVGNVDFCLDGETCIMPEFNEDALFEGIVKALKMPRRKRAAMIEAGLRMTENHKIENERKQFLDLLHQTDAIWNQKDLFKS